MNKWIWGVYPYLCITLFLLVPVIRMVFRPFAWSTRASSLFNRTSLGVASRLLHWGVLLVLAGHLAGLFGGLAGSEGAIRFFFWVGLIGGSMVLLGSVVALYRRFASPEVRAMSQPDDYIVHLFLIPIVGLALYQVVAHRIFGIAYTASSWAASLWTLSPQPELMASASPITKVHVFLALTFFAYFPFTKLVHAWTYPVNYFVRPYQSMRTVKYRLQKRWEFMLRSDKSWLTYSLGIVVLVFLAAGAMLGRIAVANATTESGGTAGLVDGRLSGMPLYISQCARCHGVGGRGDGAGAGSPTFAATPRDFTTGTYAFISTDNGVASDEDLARTIGRGLPLSGMPGFGHLSDTQIRSLVDVLRTFAVENREAGKRIPIPVPPPPADSVLQAGARLFKTNCAACHGESGAGDGLLAANLPVHPANLSAGRIKAGREPSQLYLRVAAGVPPVMPPFRSTLSDDEIWAVVRFVESRIIGRQ